MKPRLLLLKKTLSRQCPFLSNIAPHLGGEGKAVSHLSLLMSKLRFPGQRDPGHRRASPWGSCLQSRPAPAGALSWTSGCWFQRAHWASKKKSCSLCSRVKIKSIHITVNSETHSAVEAWYILFQSSFSTWFSSRPCAQSSWGCGLVPRPTASPRQMSNFGEWAAVPKPCQLSSGRPMVFFSPLSTLEFLKTLFSVHIPQSLCWEVGVAI